MNCHPIAGCDMRLCACASPRSLSMSSSPSPPTSLFFHRCRFDDRAKLSAIYKGVNLVPLQKALGSVLTVWH
jgi:hypothetical protein